MRLTKKLSAYDPKHASSPVKHGETCALAWACGTASGTGSVIFIDDVTPDGSSRNGEFLKKAVR